VTADRLLFRQEAIDFQRHHRQWGNAALLQPFSTKVLSWFLATVVALGASFLVSGKYARKETVVGYLTPVSGTSKVFVPQQGIIGEIHVKDGQEVEEGQPLLTVETSQIAANGRDVNADMLESLNSQKDHLNQQIVAEQERGSSEHRRLTDLIVGLNAEIAQLEAQIKTQIERIKISEGLVTSAAGLREKGFMSDVEFKRRQLAVLEQQQNLSSLNERLAATQSRLVETRYSLQQLPTVIADKIQHLRNELSSAEQRIAEINGRRAYVLRSPTTGRVSTLQATLGQFADPKRLQLEIIPGDHALQAELFVPTRAIGFVQAGQDIRIMYDAFPYQNFGTYRGKVTKVSGTILTGNDASGPISLKEPAYRVSASLERSTIDAYGRRIALQADMLLRADIILEKRSLLIWFLDPLLSVRMSPS
jgi:membrane fusion protein